MDASKQDLKTLKQHGWVKDSLTSIEQLPDHIVIHVDITASVEYIAEIRHQEDNEFMRFAQENPKAFLEQFRIPWLPLKYGWIAIDISNLFRED